MLKMKNRLMETADPCVVELFKKVERLGRTFDRLDKQSGKPSLFGERFISDRELSEKLKLSRRALQVYRARGIFPYYLICGKVLYKESEIERVLQNSRKGLPALEDLV